MNIYPSLKINLPVRPMAKELNQKTVNVTFKALNLIEGNGIKTYTRTVTAYNTAGVISYLEDQFFTDIYIVNIK